ncbi:hypothetical protein MZE98_10885 [Neisseria gonorrhoeae]|uniref:Uncharacterized protein n=2 Tax=Neisseria gonorrhoeae TaxID=485 RepID=A0AB74ECV2_NEIGO|nr:hypothetical protein [Neisseria gonorrhoeae]MCK2173541.1 hypothetical protein [Neisseria gonorrhoeae]SBN24701.1 Uncharacterised protein [Neisseria gonorrhoeae]SBQ18153.1 Uncharacterised protein [Neisseria gonorrhoeae]STZ92753.1 Uncharacterised protein [Neisseria gonorrhoeae]
MNRWASVRHSHQSNISTVFIESIESIESAPFDNLTLCNRTVIPAKVGIQDSKSQETVLPDKFLH